MKDIRKKGIVRIEGVQYDDDGKPYSSWWMDFDENGKQGRSGDFDIKDVLPG
jgi:hypothetical protein